MIHLHKDEAESLGGNWKLIKDYYCTFGDFYIEESLRRVFEGIYITRTLHELNEVFAPGSLCKYPNINSKRPNINSSSKVFGLNCDDSFYVIPTLWKIGKNKLAPHEIRKKLTDK